jgi:hypothetical protein
VNSLLRAKGIKNSFTHIPTLKKLLKDTQMFSLGIKNNLIVVTKVFLLLIIFNPNTNKAFKGNNKIISLGIKNILLVVSKVFG